MSLESTLTAEVRKSVIEGIERYRRETTIIKLFEQANDSNVDEVTDELKQVVESLTSLNSPDLKEIYQIGFRTSKFCTKFKSMIALHAIGELEDSIVLEEFEKVLFARVNHSVGDTKKNLVSQYLGVVAKIDEAKFEQFYNWNMYGHAYLDQIKRNTSNQLPALAEINPMKFSDLAIKSILFRGHVVKQASLSNLNDLLRVNQGGYLAAMKFILDDTVINNQFEVTNSLENLSEINPTEFRRIVNEQVLLYLEGKSPKLTVARNLDTFAKLFPSDIAEHLKVFFENELMTSKSRHFNYPEEILIGHLGVVVNENKELFSQFCKKGITYAPDTEVFEETVRNLHLLLDSDPELYVKILNDALKEKNDSLINPMAKSFDQFILKNKEEFVKFYERYFNINSRMIDEGVTEQIHHLAKINPEKYVEIFWNNLNKKLYVLKLGTAKSLGGLAKADPKRYVEVFEKILASRRNHEVKDEVFGTLDSLVEEDTEEFLRLFEKSIDFKLYLVNCLPSVARKDIGLFLKHVEYFVDYFEYQSELEIESFFEALDVMSDNEPVKFIETCRNLMERSENYDDYIRKNLEKISRISIEDYKKMFMKLIESKDKFQTGKVFESISFLPQYDLDLFEELFIKGINHSNHRVRFKTAETLDKVIAVSPKKYLELYGVAIANNDNHVKRVVTKSLEDFALTLTEEKITPLKDKANKFSRDYLSSPCAERDVKRLGLNYVKDKLKDIAISDKSNFDRMQSVLNKNPEGIDEIIECSRIKVKDYRIIKKAGRGTIKKAYRAVSSHSERETVFLMIEPNSRGFSRQKKVHGENLNDKEIMEKILEAEFSSGDLLDLTDRRYIALIHGIHTGTDDKGEPVYFLKSDPYERTLEEIEGEIKIEISAKYAYQMALALNNCHQEGIVHKDLKPGNIGIDKKGDIKLSDFGCATQFSVSSNDLYRYPLLLSPPEMATDKPTEATPEANTWSFGAIIYQLIMGEPLIELKYQRTELGTAEHIKQKKDAFAKIKDSEYIEKRIDEMNQKFGDSVLKYNRMESELRSGVIFKNEIDQTEYNQLKAIAICYIVIRSSLNQDPKKRKLERTLKSIESKI